MQTFARPSFASDRNLEFSIIIPTLNEGAHIGRLLNSLHSQLIDNFEIIIADGGSQDATAKIARSFGARVFVLEGAKEFEARNYAAAQSKASILVFTCADVIFPRTALKSVLHQFQTDSGLVALTGPDIPYDGGPTLWFTYGLYNILRLLFSRLPYPLKAFSSSTNFLVVRRETFEHSGGFRANDVNADGLMGRYLASHHKTFFDSRLSVYISARRALSWGFSRFARHYLYVVENFFPRISKQQWFQMLKSGSSERHGQIHGDKEA